jgi:hypothetical protein
MGRSVHGPIVQATADTRLRTPHRRPRQG